MKLALIKAFLHLLPAGLEVHPHRIETLILEIEPEIETKSLTSPQFRRIKEEFQSKLLEKQECNVINFVFEGDL